MKLGIILNTNTPGTVWNALRLGDKALAKGNEASMFLLGSGVEIGSIKDKAFDVAGGLEKFLNSGGNLAACAPVSN